MNLDRRRFLVLSGAAVAAASLPFAVLIGGLDKGPSPARRTIRP